MVNFRNILGRTTTNPWWPWEAQYFMRFYNVVAHRQGNVLAFGPPIFSKGYIGE